MRYKKLIPGRVYTFYEPNHGNTYTFRYMDDRQTLSLCTSIGDAWSNTRTVVDIFHTEFTKDYEFGKYRAPDRWEKDSFTVWEHEYKLIKQQIKE